MGAPPSTAYRLPSLAQQIRGKIVHFVVKARNLAHMYIIPKQVNLAIVPSQIMPGATVTAIFQNGHYPRNEEAQNLQFLLYI